MTHPLWLRRTDEQRRTPAERELVLLPRWAQVAYAVRCGRRVQPIIDHAEAVTVDQRAAVEAALSCAERSARAGRTDPASLAAARAVDVPDLAGPAAVDASGAASDSAHAAHDADDPESRLVDPEWNIAAHDAGFAAYLSAQRVSPAAAAETSAAAWSDYERLLAFARSEGWKDETPVDPDRLGPLWPSGSAPAWLSEPHRAQP